MLATAGRDTHIRLYDETTKSLFLNLKEKGDLPGHSNRIFCVKFNPIIPQVLVSGGWDNTIQIYDTREKGPVASLYGPHVCGDSIDFRNDGVTLLTGSYRQDDALQTWDLRTLKCTRTYEWDGLDGGKSFVEKDNALIPKVDNQDDDKEHMQRFKPQSPPMLYASMFNRK